MIALIELEAETYRQLRLLVPSALTARTYVGCIVSVLIEKRTFLGHVLALVDQTERSCQGEVVDVVGIEIPLNPATIKLARWLADYYCCRSFRTLEVVITTLAGNERRGGIAVRAQAWASLSRAKRKTAQRLEKVSDEDLDVPFGELLDFVEGTPNTLSYYELFQREVDPPRRPIRVSRISAPTSNLPQGLLEASNANLLNTITSSIDATLGGRTCKVGDTAAPSNQGTPFLMWGVSRNERWEICLRAVEHAFSTGSGVIILLPEYLITPAVCDSIATRLGHNARGSIAVLHKHHSPRERHDVLHRIRQGSVRVVIGARSAIFAPIQKLGLIVVEDEHEYSHKNAENPRFHSRDIAVLRGQMEGCIVLLASATPSLESFYNSTNGKYKLLKMPESEHTSGCSRSVRVVDMREGSRELKGLPIFSPQLKEAIEERLAGKEQSVLLLGRRGYATSLYCPLCAFVASCPNCSVSLAYCKRAGRLYCPICGSSERYPDACPNRDCRGLELRMGGLGTQRVQATLETLFPRARVIRVDADTIADKRDLGRLLTDFRERKHDILVGTEMGGKAISFPHVSLVGVLLADLLLQQPDFRAGERTFQFLSNLLNVDCADVRRREVIIQAFTPFHPAIQYARRGDYQGFYDQEAEFRQQLKYPPFSRIALLTIWGPNEDAVRFCTDHLRRKMEAIVADLKNVILVGPAPAPLLRTNTYYRYQIMLRTPRMSTLAARLNVVADEFVPPEGISVSIDVDPLDLA